MARKAPTQRLKSRRAHVTEKEHTPAADGQNDVKPPCSLEGGKSGMAQEVDDFAKAQRILTNDLFWIDWPNAKFELHQLALLAVQYKNCLKGEELLLRSAIETLCASSVASVRSSISLLINLRRCRKEIQEDFTKIYRMLHRYMKRETNRASLPTTKSATRRPSPEARPRHDGSYPDGPPGCT